MPDKKQRVTVFHFHPFPRRSVTNRALREAFREVPEVELRDLYELYPEFDIDVEREQEVLLRTDIVLFQHPFYWYNCPSLMKEWLDAVLEKGWAYGEGGTKLRGKYWMQAITSGGPDKAYHRTGNNHFSMYELLRPFEQTARLCGMLPLKPFLVQGTFGLNDERRSEISGKYQELLRQLARGELPPVYNTDAFPEVTGP